MPYGMVIKNAHGQVIADTENPVYVDSGGSGWLDSDPFLLNSGIADSYGVSRPVWLRGVVFEPGAFDRSRGDIPLIELKVGDVLWDSLAQEDPSLDSQFVAIITTNQTEQREVRVARRVLNSDVVSGDYNFACFDQSGTLTFLSSERMMNIRGFVSRTLAANQIVTFNSDRPAAKFIPILPLRRNLVFQGRGGHVHRRTNTEWAFFLRQNAPVQPNVTATTFIVDFGS